MRDGYAILPMGRTARGNFCACVGNFPMVNCLKTERCHRLTHPDASGIASSQLVHNETCLHKAFYVMSDLYVSRIVIGQPHFWKQERTNERKGER